MAIFTKGVIGACIVGALLGGPVGLIIGGVGVYAYQHSQEKIVIHVDKDGKIEKAKK